MFDQWLLQRANHQLHAGSLGLGIEVVDGGQARTVVELNDRWLLPGLFSLVVGGHETFAQRLADGGQWAFLRQQQGDLVQGLAGQFLELGQRCWQLHGGRVARVLCAPGVDSGLLLLERTGALDRLGQGDPAVQGRVAAGLQLFCRQCGDQDPDGFVIAFSGVAAEQWRHGAGKDLCGWL